MRIGNKKIFHLEAWVVKVMCLHKASNQVGLMERVPYSHYSISFMVLTWMMALSDQVCEPQIQASSTVVLFY